MCVSHRHNSDGYFRKRWQDGIEMFHRYIYRAHKGEIPEGWEVDHLCGVRPCCNPEHLEAIRGDEHAAKTNRSRYAERKANAKAAWLRLRLSGVVLASVYGVSFSAACGWIREWKKQ